jgi:hypothetical protein
MSEKNMILADRRNKLSVMTPLRKESANPVVRFLTHQIELISRFIGKMVNA